MAFTDAFQVVTATADLPLEAWRKIRNQGIGGSDVGAICGLNNWKTPYAVYLDKIGQGQQVEENLAMELGIELEDSVARLFAKKTGMKVEAYPYVLSSKEYPYMFANVDRLILDDSGAVIAGLECKTALSFGGAAGWADDKVPESYLLQCYHYMIVTGLDTWYIAALTTGPQFVIQKIELDAEMRDRVIAIESEFWQRVQNQDAPMVTGDDISLIEYSMVPVEDSKEIALLPEHARALAMEYKIAGDTEKEAKTAKDDAKAQLCQLLAGHDKGKIGEFTINWTPVSTNRLDTDRLKKEKPEVYQEYCKSDSSRRFSIK